MTLNHPLRVIRRYNEPTKLDTADYLTLCRVGYDYDDFLKVQYYIQVSKESEKPKWENIGTPSEEFLLKLIDLCK